MTSTEWSYWGGFTVFSASSGPPAPELWEYYGGFFVFSSVSTGAAPPSPTLWEYWGGFFVFGSATPATTSSGPPPTPVSVPGLYLISPTFQSYSGRLTSPRV